MAGSISLLHLTLKWALFTFCYLTYAEEEIFDLPKIQAVKELSDNILRNYSKHILPSEKMPFNVTVWIHLHTLGEIDEIEEMMGYVFWLSYSWKDESIKWNRNDTNMEWLTLDWNDVWTPVFRVSNPHAAISKSLSVDRSYDTVIYSNEGTAFFSELMTTRTTCDLDMTYYPFDIQSCSIELFIVGHRKFLFNIKAALDNEIKDNENHGSWTLINQTVTTQYGTLMIKFIFKRRPLFLLVNIFLPIIVLALLTPIVFMLPKRSGERVGFSITMLLAISVYMTIVSEHLPQNSQPMPLITIMIFICYILDATIVFVVIINTKINAKDTNGQLPYLCKKLVLLTRRILTIFQCEKSNENHKVDSVGENEKGLGSTTLIEMEKDDEHSIILDDFCEINDVTWKDVSNTIDKWCFMITYLCKIMLPVIFFSICKTKSGRDLINEN